MKSRPLRPPDGRRGFLGLLLSLTLIYPVLRFVGYRVPRQPTLVPINKPIPLGGVLLTADFILFDRNDHCWALSRTCTHLGCKLNYHEEKNILECPCHNSQFEAETGEVLRGPAEKKLPFFPVEKRDGDPYYVVTV
jgi:cytochrome b6-f complex iron-sulfur subunit